MKPATAQIRKSQGIKVNRVTSAPFSAQPSPTHEIDGLSTVSPSDWATHSNGEDE